MHSPSADSHRLRIEERARELGFDRCGVARAEALDEDLARLRQWIADGRHGSMAWMADEPQRRCDPRMVLPGCRSVVVVGMTYDVPDAADRRDPAPAGRIARYARGRDYHRIMQKPLRKLARFVDGLCEVDVRSKPYMDHGLVMERQWAARAGLGFIGKHTLLIDPRGGSWFFLGVLLTALDIEPSPAIDPGAGCGDCRRCIDACPTGAIDAPWQLDARRCISYLTIEHRGPVDPELASKFEGWAFGCDICQEVCPYNRKRARPAEGSPFAERLVPAEWSLAEMLALTQEEIDGPLRQSPLRRAGAEMLRRNAGIVGEAGGTDSPCGP